MIPKEFDYVAATSVEEALSALRDGGEDAKLLAGGHSLIPMMKLRLAAPSRLVDLGGVAELRHIQTAPDHVGVGAMVTYQTLENSQELMQRCPLLGECASNIGDAQVRARGTVGGSLAHADPAADLPAAVLALDATLMVAHLNGSMTTRDIAAHDFFQDLFMTALEPGEMLAGLKIPALPAGTGTAYVKIRNKASHYALVGAAAVLTVGSDGVCNNAAVAITGAASKPFRLEVVESRLKGSRLGADEIKAAIDSLDGVDAEWMSDLFGSAEYRKHLAAVVAGRAIETARGRAH